VDQHTKRTIEVFKALKEGRCWQIGLSAEQVQRLCPEVALEPGWEIHSSFEEVGVAEGIVIDWNRHGGHAHCLKVHWQCMFCGREHISDFEPHADSNPVLWFCENGSGRMCLVRWIQEDPN
jgi:hypothetical protein